jgi:fermentation-respiration switch protein FrsA (DUF1100 family)
MTEPTREQPPSPIAEPTYSHVPFIRRAMLGTLALVIGVYMVWWVAIYLMQTSLLYINDELAEPAKQQPYPHITELKRPLDAGGSVTAWLVTDPDAPDDEPRPLLVYAHGGGELIDYQQPTVMPYLTLGFDVLLPEYRGFGRSAGEPSQAGISEDVRYFIDQAAQRDDIDASRVVYHGKGIGGAILADVALEAPPMALILESTFASGAQLMHDLYAPALLLRDPYRTDHALRRLVLPVIIYHGQTNDRYAFSHAEHLHEMAPRSDLQAYPDADPAFPGLMFMPEFWRRNATKLVDLGVIAMPQPPADDAPATQSPPIIDGS